MVALAGQQVKFSAMNLDETIYCDYLLICDTDMDIESLVGRVNDAQQQMPDIKDKVIYIDFDPPLVLVSADHLLMRYIVRRRVHVAKIRV